jgi:hypothetical protein
MSHTDALDPVTRNVTGNSVLRLVRKSSHSASGTVAWVYHSSAIQLRNGDAKSS